MIDEDDLFPWDEPTIKESPTTRPEIQPDPEPQPDPTPIPTTTTDDHSKQLWLAMQQYYEMGLSLVWGRAEPEITKTTVHKAKTPLVKTWSSEPEGKYTLEALATMMHKAKPGLQLAPIIICGKASGNLYAIDIDNKHWPGIDARYFKSIQDIYPDLWRRLRIHRTPSGGYHILYRLLELILVMGKSNPKLAWKEGEKEAGIEMRTHGGYILAPPGADYEVVQDVPIPTITVEEHNALIELAILLNEKVTIKESPKPKAYESVYTENPFQHFNSAPAAELVLHNHGWTLYKHETDQYAHYTRPGKDGGISATYIKNKRLYHIFTSSTELLPETYTPAHLRCALECGGDYKKFYTVLVQEKYGRHKPDYEAKYVKKATETGNPLPPNFSPEANQQLEVAIEQKAERYPYGIFWEYDPKSDSYDIHREKLKQCLYKAGLRLHLGEPCQIRGNFIHKLKESKKENGARDIYNLLYDWVKEEEEVTFLKIQHELSRFWQSAGDFIVTTLTNLDKNLILRSNPKATYKVFKNGVLVITKDEIRLERNFIFNGLLAWADDVIDREFTYVDREAQEKSMYGDFVLKAVGGNRDYVRKVIGFLCCGYKLDSESYLIAMMEPMDSSKGGGTGKGFFMKILRFWTEVLITNGQAVKKDIDQLIQNWQGEPLVHLSDLPKWVNLSDLKHVVSDDSQRKLLYQNIANVSSEDMPKFVLSGQFGLNTEDDGGVKGRIRQLAFTNYFGRLGNTIRDEYGGDCPEVWTDGDWDGYFSFIADSVKMYLGVRKLELVDDVGLWLKGWDMRFSGGESYLREAWEDKMEGWSKVDYLTNGQVWEWYEGVTKNMPASAKLRSVGRLHAALQEYGEKMGLYEYDYGDRTYVDGIQQRVVKIKLAKKESVVGGLEGPEWDEPGANGSTEDEMPF